MNKKQNDFIDYINQNLISKEEAKNVGLTSLSSVSFRVFFSEQIYWLTILRFLYENLDVRVFTNQILKNNVYPAGLSLYILSDQKNIILRYADLSNKFGYRKAVLLLMNKKPKKWWSKPPKMGSLVDSRDF